MYHMLVKAVQHSIYITGDESAREYCVSISFICYLIYSCCQPFKEHIVTLLVTFTDVENQPLKAARPEVDSYYMIKSQLSNIQTAIFGCCFRQHGIKCEGIPTHYRWIKEFQQVDINLDFPQNRRHVQLVLFPSLQGTKLRPTHFRVMESMSSQRPSRCSYKCFDSISSAFSCVLFVLV